jgi:uncharacterized protein YjaG (DUF416 family)
MTILHYNEQELAAELGGIPARYRATFAAACAERLLPAYSDFFRRVGRGDPVKLAAILARLWRDLEGQKMADEEVKECLDVCMNLIPREDEGTWVPEQAAAEDAGSALAYALRCRQTGNAQEAAWAARRSYEALDHFVVAQEDIDTNAAFGENRVLLHPLVQAELARQRRDMEELLGAAETELPNIASRVQQRAKADAQMFFRLGS